MIGHIVTGVGVGFVFCLGNLQVASVQTAELPHPDVVIRDYIDALGSEMAILGVESLRIRGNFVGSRSGTLEFIYVAGKSRLNFNVDGDESQQIAYVFDGRVAWQVQQGGTTTLAEPASQDNIRESVSNPFTALYWAEYPGQIEVLGSVAVGESETFHLQFTSANGTVFDRFFDVKTNLLVKSVFHDEAGGRTITNEYEQYRIHDGIQFIGKKRQFHDGEFTYTYTFDEIEMNVDDVDEALFQVPDELAEEAKRRLATPSQKSDTDNGSDR